MITIWQKSGCMPSHIPEFTNNGFLVSLLLHPSLNFLLLLEVQQVCREVLSKRYVSLKRSTKRESITFCIWSYWEMIIWFLSCKNSFIMNEARLKSTVKNASWSIWSRDSSSVCFELLGTNYINQSVWLLSGRYFSLLAGTLLIVEVLPHKSDYFPLDFCSAVLTATLLVA